MNMPHVGMSPDLASKAASRVMDVKLKTKPILKNASPTRGSRKGIETNTRKTSYATRMMGGSDNC